MCISAEKLGLKNFLVPPVRKTSNSQPIYYQEHHKVSIADVPDGRQYGDSLLRPTSAAVSFATGPGFVPH